MLIFFQKIKQQLIVEGNLKKYLLYATGEILIVMIGILLAVEVNNWNNYRRDRESERSLLINIKEDLSLDTLDLIFNMNLHKKFLKNEIALLHLITNSFVDDTDSINYSDALGISLSVVLHKTAYNSLQNSPADIIRNKKLRNKIARHYDFFYKGLEFFEDVNPDYHFYTIKLPYFEKHFTIRNKLEQSFPNPQSKDYYAYESIREEIQPIDIETLINDKAFALILSECIFNRKMGINMYEQSLEKIHELCDDIDKELQMD